MFILIFLQFKFEMKKAFIVLALIVLGQMTLDSRLPDAIRCGADGSGLDGAVYIIHNYKAWDTKTIHYYQIYTPEHRYVYFNEDGGYNNGGGDYPSRKGCQNKSLATLDKQGRTIYYALDPSKGKKFEDDNAIKKKIEMLEQQEIIKDKNMKKMEEEISELKKKLLSFSANFWEYEQIKQTWLRDFEEKIVGNIKSKGLQIGSRWKLQQQGNSFVIRDSVGSNAKDSRIAFPADTFLNPK